MWPKVWAEGVGEGAGEGVGVRCGHGWQQWPLGAEAGGEGGGVVEDEDAGSLRTGAANDNKPSRGLDADWGPLPEYGAL